jgi:hypothetical protein
MDQFLETFTIVVEKNRPPLETNQVNYFVGHWLNSAVLKLQKKEWSAPAPNESPFHSGIFFSIWIESKDLPNAIFNYNIHALKLRNLKAYTLKSREFADAFRTIFAADQHSWENVSVNYGPLTLMQGAITLNPQTFQTEVDRWVKKFIPLATTIDQLLDKRKKA